VGGVRIGGEGREGVELSGRKKDDADTEVGRAKMLEGRKGSGKERCDKNLGIKTG